MTNLPAPQPAKNPCGSCPYRKDVPSGVWAVSEYLKLVEYDRPTGEQPVHVAQRQAADLQVDGLPLEFLQNKEPKLREDDLPPVEWPPHPDLEWCPPGHGDIYTALRGTGLLDRLIEAGFTQAFVSNSDNLGAVPDARVALMPPMEASAPGSMGKNRPVWRISSSTTAFRSSVSPACWLFSG